MLQDTLYHNINNNNNTNNQVKVTLKHKVLIGKYK